MYRLTCYNFTDDHQVYQKEFDSKEAVAEYMQAEFEGDMGDSTRYTYELERSSGWERIPFRLKVEF